MHTNYAQTETQLSPANLQLPEECSQLLQCLVRSSSEDELLLGISKTVELYAKAESCDILIKDKNQALVLRASTTFPNHVNRIQLNKALGVVGYADEAGETIVIPDKLPNHPCYIPYISIQQESQFVSCIAIPMIEDEKVLGVLLLRRTFPYQPTASELTYLEKLVQFGTQTLRSYQNAYNAGSKATSHLGALNEVTKTITGSPYLEEILQLIVNITAQQFDYKVCSLRLLDTDKDLLVLRATQSPVKAYLQKRAIQLGESIAGRAINENKPIIVTDVQKDPEYIGHDLAIELSLRSMICVPLTIQNRVVGVLSCYTDHIRDFHPDEIRALETLAKQAALSIEHAKLQVRSTLMQEMHHRVKNNLQQVVSLLRLQLRGCAYTSTEDAINDTLSRILAIAAVHDLLSRDDLDHVDVKTIAETLTHMLQQSLVPPSKQITFLVRGHDIYLNMNQATQIALILNELIQNSIEHGFHYTESGEIHVTIEEENNEVILWVAELGDPLPENFSISNNGQLGLQIVDSLSRGLGGYFKLEGKCGWTVAEVRFPRATGE